MYKIIYATLAIFLMSGAFLSEAKAVDQSKWAFVNVKQAILETEKGKKAYSDLQKLKDERQKELEKDRQQLQTTGEELQQQRSTLSEEAFNRKNRDFAQQQMSLQKKLETYEYELAKKQDDMAQDILKDMEIIIKDIAKQKGYEVIFEKTGSGLLYANVQNDVTSEVVKRYNKKMKKSGKKK